MPFPADVKVGDTVVAVGRVENNIGDFHPDGTEFLVCELEGDKALALSDDFDKNEGIWFYTGEFATLCDMLDNQFTIKGE